MNILSYCKATDTIRQLPQGYCIAVRKGTMWHLDWDSAAERKLVDRVYNALWEHDNRFGTGLKLLSAVTPNKEWN